MQNAVSGKPFLPLLFFFICASVVILALHFAFPASTIDFKVLLGGNILLFLIGWISMQMSMGALRHKSVQVFLRLVYGSFLLKFFIIAIVAFIYIFTYKKAVNKPALFGCFGLYFIYTFIEVRSVLKQSKNSNA